MKSLLEISKIVTKKKANKIEVFNEYTLKQKKSKFNEFYEALQSGKFRNDRDAAKFLYGTSPTDDKYRQLKSRFRKRLMNTLFFLDVNRPSASSYDRAYFSCNKDWTLVKILLSNSAHHTASIISKQILTTAQKYQFADIIVNASRILREYSARIGDAKGFELYDQHAKQHQDILNAEIRSEELFQRVYLAYDKSEDEVAALQERMEAYAQALYSLGDIFQSPVIHYNRLLIDAYKLEIERDFDGVIAVCKNVDEYIEENPLYYRDELYRFFLTKKLSAYLHKLDIKGGKEVVEQSDKYFHEGSLEWFQFMEHFILLAFATNNLIQALGVFHKAVGNSGFKKLDPEEQEKWVLFEIYLAYFLSTDRDNAEEMLKVGRRKVFRIKRFLDQQQLYPASMRVFHVHSLIAQVLFLIEQRNLNAAREIIDQLKYIANRQLQKEQYFRTVQFIRLLQQLAKADFDVVEIRNSDKYYERLSSKKYFYRGVVSDFEIMPYELLWNFLLTRVDKLIS